MFQPTPHGVFEENPSELTWRNWPPQLKRHSKHWLHMVREKKMKELQSFIKIETILCQCQVPSLFWGTSDGQQDNTSWSSEDVRFPVGWDQISAAVFPWHGSGGMDHSIIIQGMDPGGPRPWSIAFSPPSCKPSYRMLQRHEIVIRSHIFLSFPRFLAIPWPLGPPTGGQLAHGIVQLRFIKADLQKKQAGQLGRL